MPQHRRQVCAQQFCLKHFPVGVNLKVNLVMLGLANIIFIKITTA